MKFIFSFENKTEIGRKWFDVVIEAESLGAAVKATKKYAGNDACMRGVEREDKVKYTVEYTDVNKATSAIDNIEAREGYTAQDYIRDCESNADEEWCDMLQAGEVSLVRDVPLDEIYRMLDQDERDRKEHPCCANCKLHYDEYGADLCKYWDSPMDDLQNDKCNHWT